MPKVLRFLARAVSVLTVVVFLAVAASLATVDPAAMRQQPYWGAAQARLAALRGDPGAAAVQGELRAGFGRAKLTPTVGAVADRPELGEFTALPLAGYGNRQGRPAEGVHDDLWVKAVAFSVGGRTGVVVAADALIIPAEVSAVAVERLRSTRGLGVGDLYFGATHSHCSLGGWGEGLVAEAFAGGYRPPVRTWFAQQLAAAAEAALADLGPASWGSTSFAAPDFTRNRLVGDRGEIDPEFSLRVLRKADGRQAVIGSFAAHATVLSGGMMEFSADYPGAWQRSVETGGVSLAVFLAGGVGSHAPRAPAGGLEGVERMGAQLAERTAHVLAGLALTNRLALDFRTVEVDLPELQPRITDGVRVRPWLAAQLLPVRPRTRLQALRWNDDVWLSTPCDYSGELALRLKADAARARLKVAVTSFNGDYVGYVIPSKYYHLSGYEPRTMAFFGPQLPDYFDAILHGLLGLEAGAGEGEGGVR